MANVKILDASVSNYGTVLSIKIDGPDLPHLDKRFPVDSLRILRLTAEDLAPFIERAVADYSVKVVAHG